MQRILHHTLMVSLPKSTDITAACAATASSSAQSAARSTFIIPAFRRIVFRDQLSTCLRPRCLSCSRSCVQIARFGHERMVRTLKHCCLARRLKARSEQCFQSTCQTPARLCVCIKRTVTGFSKEIQAQVRARRGPAQFSAIEERNLLSLHQMCTISR